MTLQPDGETESSMTLWVLCEHGEKGSHYIYAANYLPELDCPGGRPATPEDLYEALGGEKVWWCVVHESERLEGTPFCGQGAFQDHGDWNDLMAIAFAFEKDPNTPLLATIDCRIVEGRIILTPALDQEASK